MPDSGQNRRATPSKNRPWTDEAFNDAFIKKVMPFVGVTLVAAIAALVIARLAGASREAAGLIFVAVAVIGSAVAVVAAVVMGTSYRKRQ